MTDVTHSYDKWLLIKKTRMTDQWRRLLLDEVFWVAAFPYVNDWVSVSERSAQGVESWLYAPTLKAAGAALGISGGRIRQVVIRTSMVMNRRHQRGPDWHPVCEVPTCTQAVKYFHDRSVWDESLGRSVPTGDHSRCRQHKNWKEGQDPFPPPKVTKDDQTRALQARVKELEARL